MGVMCPYMYPLEGNERHRLTQARTRKFVVADGFLRHLVLRFALANICLCLDHKFS